jgi:hypothetical protein
MVTRPHNRRGKSTLGCLFTVLLLAAGGYVGLQFARPWFASKQYRDEMRNVGSFAQTSNDAVLRAAILARADSLDLPPAAKRNLKIQRLSKPPHLLIESEYEYTVTLPFLGSRVMTLHPHVQIAL